MIAAIEQHLAASRLRAAALLWGLHMKRIMRFSARLYLVTKGLFWLLILGWAILGVLCFTTSWIQIDDLTGRPAGLNDAPLSARVLAFALSSAVLVIVAYAIDQLAKMLALYAQGSIFTHESAVHLRKFGLLLFAIPFVDTAKQLGNDGISYLVNPLTTRSFELNIDIFHMLLGAVFALLAQIMVEATTISDEAKLTV